VLFFNMFKLTEMLWLTPAFGNGAVFRSFSDCSLSVALPTPTE